MHPDMTTVTIQSNKIVLNEIKDSSVPSRAILMGEKKNEPFIWLTPIYRV